jgi:hypothetical protein
MQTTPQGRSFLGDERCTAAILVFVTTTVLGMRGWRKAGLMAAENTRGNSQMEDGEGEGSQGEGTESRLWVGYNDFPLYSCVKARG